jgi:hypothetical protein
MSAVDKKKKKLQERLALLEQELLVSLTKKTSTTTEIDVPGHTRKIKELKDQLSKM